MTASYFFFLAGRRATRSGSAASPHSNESLSASNPLSVAILFQRSENAPTVTESTRDGFAFWRPASMRPVAEDVARSTKFFVSKTAGMRFSIRSCRSAYDLPRWPIIGFESAARTSGRTQTGPGRKNFTVPAKGCFSLMRRFFPARRLMSMEREPARTQSRAASSARSSISRSAPAVSRNSREREPVGTTIARHPPARANSTSTSMSPTQTVASGVEPIAAIRARSIEGSGFGA